MIGFLVSSCVGGYQGTTSSYDMFESSKIIFFIGKWSWLSVHEKIGEKQFFAAYLFFEIITI